MAGERLSGRRQEAWRGGRTRQWRKARGEEKNPIRGMTVHSNLPGLRPWLGAFFSAKALPEKRPPPDGEGTFRFKAGERSDEADALDPTADPTAEAEGRTGAEQGQGAGDSLGEVVGEVIRAYTG